MNDLHLQVGQLMIMGFEGTTISPNVESLLETIQPAGVVLFAATSAKLIKSIVSLATARIW